MWSFSVSGSDFDSSHDLFVFVLEKEKTVADKNQHEVSAFIFHFAISKLLSLCRNHSGTK